jgi:NAD(P)-dependent dehydrogenase (short-subunit alcohol dehydrogenase family)
MRVANRMKVVVIGATGILGTAVDNVLASAGHEVVKASRRGSLAVDLEDPATVDRMFDEVRDVHAVICCAASGPLIDLGTATDEEFGNGIRTKLLGQVAVARRAIHHVLDDGSVTLTGGRFASPLASGSLGALVNSGLEGFVRNSAAELPRGLRINLVSPGWIRESLLEMGEAGGAGTPAAEVARSYLDCVEGNFTGRTLTDW